MDVLAPHKYVSPPLVHVRTMTHLSLEKFTCLHIDTRMNDS